MITLSAKIKPYTILFLNFNEKEVILDKLNLKNLPFR